MAPQNRQRTHEERSSSVLLALPSSAPTQPPILSHTFFGNTSDSDVASDNQAAPSVCSVVRRRGSEFERSTTQLPMRPRAKALARRPYRRALLIGVATAAPSPVGPDTMQDGDMSAAQGVNDARPLRAHEDVMAIQTLLIDVYKYRPEDITVMLEHEDTSPHLIPNEQNIECQIRKLVKHARFGDRFFFYYAGHGTQMPCESGTETDGNDEFMCCMDGWMKDNRLKQLLVKPLPPGARLFALIDACCAGTMLDLRHYRCNHVNARAVDTDHQPAVCVTLHLRVVFFVVHRVQRLTVRLRATIRARVVSRTHSIPTVAECGLGVRRTPVRAFSLGIPSTPPSSPVIAPLMRPFSAIPAINTVVLGASTAVPGASTAAPGIAIAALVGADHCTGRCDPPHTSLDLAWPLVISLGAARDCEEAWENGESGLFTGAFLKAARDNPAQKFEVLLHALAEGCDKAKAARVELVAQYRLWASHRSIEVVQAEKQRIGIDWDDPKWIAAQRPLMSSMQPINPRLSLTAMI